MPALPPNVDLSGSGAIPTSATFRSAIGGVRDYLASLLGATGTAAEARTLLGISPSTDFVNYNNQVVALNTATAFLDWDLNLGVLATVTLNGNKTFNLPTNIKNNNYTLIITQGAASHTITWNAGIDFGLLGAPDLTVVNSQTRVDLLAIGGTIRAFWTPYK